ncbi:V-type ATP synthase subunit D [Nocardia sp. NPDC046473]|uniref:V-type ATP synthase subunit D n=1 Tax=Nocardia sp. NPDC046473 TaxID=3155733 RepID=UPI0033C0EDC3
MGTLRVPPGRAGRQWLRGRLGIAEHGLSLLEQKLKILERERDRLRVLAERSRCEWESTCLEARTWQLRAVLLGGQRSIRLAAADRPAEMSIHWATAAGVRYPDRVEFVLPQGSTRAIPSSSVIVHAQSAHRAAVGAAGRYAAAAAAVHAVEREYSTTRIRAQGLHRRRIPDLVAALARVELALEEQERAENIRLRRAIEGGGGHRSRGPAARQPAADVVGTSDDDRVRRGEGEHP